MSMISSNFADELAAGFRVIFFEHYNEPSMVYNRMFNMLTDDKSYVDDSYTTGFGLLQKKTKGAAVTYEDAIQGLDTRYTHDTYELAYRIELELLEDGRYGTMKKMPQALGRSANITVETDGANVYNRAFNSDYTGADGLEMCSTVHVLMGGGTQKNELTNAANLSATSYEQAMIDLAATTDDQGKLINLQPRKLIVHPSNKYTAMKLLGSTLDPESAMNAINPIKGDVELVVNPFLSSTTAWFILCDTHEVNFFWRVPIDHMAGNDFDTDDLKHKVRGRWSRGWSMPWGVFGSPGV